MKGHEGKYSQVRWHVAVSCPLPPRGTTPYRSDVPELLYDVSELCKRTRRKIILHGRCTSRTVQESRGPRVSAPDRDADLGTGSHNPVHVLTQSKRRIGVPEPIRECVHVYPPLIIIDADFSMTPPHAKTWAPRGRTSVVRVRGCSRRRISIAALTCHKTGHRSRLIYRHRRDDGNSDGRKSFSWRDYRDLLIAAHQQLDGQIVLIWDNLNVHKAAGLREFAETRDWLIPPTTCRPTHPTSTPSKASGHFYGADGSRTSVSAPQNTSSRPSGAA